MGMWLSAFAQDPHWINYNNGKSIMALAEEGDFMWVGTLYSGLAKINKTTGEGTFYNKANSELPFNKVTSIAVDNKGTKWIGVGSGGLVSFDDHNWTVYNTDNSDLPDNDISAIAVDSNNTKWVGTWKAGLASFNGNDWVVYNTENSGLPSNLIYSIAFDKNRYFMDRHRQRFSFL